MFIVAASTGCAQGHGRLQTADSALFNSNDESDVERVVEEVNALPSACAVTPQQLAAMVASCGQGVRDDCIRAGVAYWRGCGAEEDQSRAETYLGKACGLGSATSCRLQAQVIIESTRPRPSDAAAILDQACSRGSRQACGDFGVVVTTRMKNADAAVKERGISALFAACRAGHPQFCIRLATIVERQQLSQHFPDVRMVLQEACHSHYLDACYSLAIAAEDGTLGVKDYGLGATLASQTCQKGHQPSCNAFGHMFVLGHGVAKDPYRGARLFYAACQQRYAPACHSMGEAVEKGWGVGPDHEKAREFYRYACKIGSAPSCDTDPSAPAIPNVPQR